MIVVDNHYMLQQLLVLREQAKSMPDNFLIYMFEMVAEYCEHPDDKWILDHDRPFRKSMGQRGKGKSKSTPSLIAK